MEDVDLDALAIDLGFNPKSEQKEAVRSLLRGKDIFSVLSTGQMTEEFGVRQMLQMQLLRYRSNGRKLWSSPH